MQMEDDKESVNKDPNNDTASLKKTDTIES